MIMIPPERNVADTIIAVASQSGTVDAATSNSVSMLDEYCEYLAGKAIEAIQRGDKALLSKVFKTLMEIASEGYE